VAENFWPIISTDFEITDRVSKIISLLENKWKKWQKLKEWLLWKIKVIKSKVTVINLTTFRFHRMKNKFFLNLKVLICLQFMSSNIYFYQAAFQSCVLLQMSK
jgi:hypothetical protein